MTASEIQALPLTSENYELMHQQTPGQWSDMDAFRAYYDWFQRYGHKIKPIIRHFFTDTRDMWRDRVREAS